MGKPKRTKITADDCSACGAKCCRYVVVMMDKPTRKVDLDEIRWILAHRDCLVYIDNEDKTWNVQFNTDCRHLDEAGRCRIYPDRFDVCRDYGVETCENSEGEVDAVIFNSLEEFDTWWKKHRKGKWLPGWKKERKKGKKKDRK